MKEYFKDRIYVVTGASSGIGEEICRQLAQHGAKIVAFGRDENRLQTLISELEGDSHIFVTLDIKDTLKIEESLNFVVNKKGKLSGLVHSAGIAQTMLLRDTDILKAKEILDINLLSFFALAKSALKMGRYEKGFMSVVALSSIAAFSNQAALSVYAASKAGLNAACASLASEYAKRGVRFNTIAPSYVTTPMTDIFRQILGDDKYYKKIKEIMPFGEILPKDVAQLALFLLSHNSSKITGECIKITSGGGINENILLSTK